MGKRGLAAVGLLLAIAALPAAAPAQSPAPDRLGGGTRGPAGPLVSISPAGGRVSFRVRAIAQCPPRQEVTLVLTGTFSPAADGTFASTGKLRAQGLRRGDHLSGSFKLAGRIAAGTSATGTLTAHAKFRGRGARGRCRVFGSGQQWSVRAPVHPAGPPLTAPLAAPLFGTTSRSQGAFAYAVIVDPAARGKVFVLWETGVKCTHHIRVFSFGNVTPTLSPDAQGHFAAHEAFIVNYADGPVRYREETNGQLLADGAVGTFRLRETLFAPGPGKRTVGTCDSGTVSWTAAP